jgi:hypothetical protein
MDQPPPTPSPPEPPPERDPAPRPVAVGPVRWVLLGAGWLFVVLGVLGAVLPVLPTTPFILLAAACFARSSQRFYDWLLANRVFGPLIRDWRAHRTIPNRARWTGIAMIVVFLGSSVVFFVEHPAVRAVLVAIGIGLVVFLYRLPTREAEGDAPPEAG